MSSSIQQVSTTPEVKYPTLPKGVTEKKDDPNHTLLDKRYFYEVNLFGYPKLSSLQGQVDAYYKATTPKPVEQKPDGYTWKSPFRWVASIFSQLAQYISDTFKSIFSICGFCKSDEPKVDQKTEASKGDTKTTTEKTATTDTNNNNNTPVAKEAPKK